MNECMNVCMCMCMYVRMYVYVCMYVYINELAAQSRFVEGRKSIHGRHPGTTRHTRIRPEGEGDDRGCEEARVSGRVSAGVRLRVRAMGGVAHTMLIIMYIYCVCE